MATWGSTISSWHRRRAFPGGVVDEDGKPVAGATARADNPMAIDGRGYMAASKLEAQADADGRFTIGELPQGFTQVFWYAQGYCAAESSQQIREVPAKDMTLKMARAGVIKGKAIGADGKPLAGQVNVSLESLGNVGGNWGGGMYAKPDGSFQFENVPPGKYQLSAQPNPGRAATPDNVKTITVSGGKTVEQDLTVAP